MRTTYRRRADASASMKGSTKLLLLIILIALMFLAGVIVSNQRDQDEETGGELAAPQQLFSLDSAAVTALSWGQGDDIVQIERTESTTFAVTGQSEFPLNQSYISELLDILSSLSATEMAEGVLQPEEYGLAQPIVLTVSADSATDTLYIGQPLEDGSLYISLEQHCQTLYCVDSRLYQAVDHDLLDLAVITRVPEITDPRVLTVATAQRADAYVSADAGNNTLSWSKSGKTADSAPIDAVLQAISALTWLDTVAYQPTDEQLAEYGLAQPALTVSLSYADVRQEDSGEKDANGETIYNEKNVMAVFELHIGAATPAGNYYAQLLDSPLVVTVGPELPAAVQAML